MGLTGSNSLIMIQYYEINKIIIRFDLSNVEAVLKLFSLFEREYITTGLISEYMYF